MSIKIDQALISHFIDSDFGLPIVDENSFYSPVDDPYAEIWVIPNDISALNLATKNETDGLFRIILRYPVHTGAVEAKQKADEIANEFKIGQKLTYSDQIVHIKGQSRGNGVAEDGWYKIVLTIHYRAFLAR